jgi:hypothetical protein
VITPKMLARLPKVVQSHITGLERQVAHWRAAAMSAAHVEGMQTEVTVPSFDGQAEAGLPPHSTVRFYLSRQPVRFIDVAVRNGKLDITCGTDSIAIEPRAANHAWVTAVR